MSARSACARARAVSLFTVAVMGGALVGGALASTARAQEPEWRLEQPPPPARIPGEPPLTPIGLGRIGDIEFVKPNLGVLITAGNPETIPASVWLYNGSGWHELATKCGATDGRIAWASPEEFWTISDGRPGQAPNPQNGQPAPLEDNTLCHFAGGQIAGSYASPAFEASSYQAMHAAACFAPSDCWFAGESLPEPQIGAFHLHWNGGTLSAEPNPQGHAVEAMQAFEGHLFESVRLAHNDLLGEQESAEHPSILHEISPAGVQPTFVSLLPRSSLTGSTLPEYALGEFPEALDFLRLSADAEGLWAAAGPAGEQPRGSVAAQVTVLHYFEDGETGQLAGEELIGPRTSPSGASLFPGDLVTSVAADPGTDSALIALRSQAEGGKPDPNARALVARVAADGATSTEELPSTKQMQEGVGPRGAAASITCPAAQDCWLATTEGWLFHLAPEDERRLPEDTETAFNHLITYRPPDQGLPQVVPDAPPEDDSGLNEAPPSYGVVEAEKPASMIQTEVPVALLSGMHTRIVGGSTLELRFHLAVKARVRLVAKRHASVVASTSMRTLPAGTHKLELRLDRSRWPTKLELQTHALAKLPMTSTRSPNVNSVATSLAFPNAHLRPQLLQPFSQSEPLF